MHVKRNMVKMSPNRTFDPWKTHRQVTRLVCTVMGREVEGAKQDMQVQMTVAHFYYLTRKKGFYESPRTTLDAWCKRCPRSTARHMHSVTALYLYLTSVHL